MRARVWAKCGRAMPNGLDLIPTQRNRGNTWLVSIVLRPDRMGAKTRLWGSPNPPRTSKLLGGLRKTCGRWSSCGQAGLMARTCVGRKDRGSKESREDTIRARRALSTLGQVLLVSAVGQCTPCCKPRPGMLPSHKSHAIGPCASCYRVRTTCTAELCTPYS